jgi:hypothetical protein
VDQAARVARTRHGQEYDLVPDAGHSGSPNVPASCGRCEAHDGNAVTIDKTGKLLE